jgi:hypothetical protein
MHQPGNWTAGRLVNGPVQFNKGAEDGYRHWPWEPQGRRPPTFTAPNQNDGSEALDKRSRASGEFMSQKKPGTKRYKGVRREQA